MVIRTIPAGQFKAQCLALIDSVGTHRHALVITKRGKPVARLVPASCQDAFASLEGSILEEGDIVSPLDEGWDAT